ncbi:MAG: PhzF family phenazine biosynthesis protein [Candidatus Eremiobacteraeota bacterium]|nr:PhzF family phenazine biosynthesis protein [Candidatus Eremiobacteraeota bacterium]
MAKQWAFEQVDVFTRERFMGNSLAVFTDAGGLNPTQMQAIAKEMNLSETTFVLPPDDAACAARVRIFTPGQELPFAGHPTIGTAWVLAKNGALPKDATALQLQEKVGRVPVRLEGPARDPSALFLTSPAAAFGTIFPQRAAFATALNLSEADLVADAPLQILAAPVPFLYVAAASKERVDRASINHPALLALLDGDDLSGVFIFARQPGRQAAYSRMLGLEHIGIVEDPATGSASGPLGAYMLRYGIIQGGKRVEILSEQGTKMGRQSFVSIIVERDGDTVRSIEVGGSVVPVLRGELEL